MSLKVCRTCCENEGTYSLFNENESDLQISAKVSYCCAKINIEEGDGLPSSICEECKEELEATYRFVMKCESADKKLRSQFLVTEEEIKTELKVEKNEDSDLGGECTDDNFIVYEFQPVIDSEPSNKKVKKNEDTDLDREGKDDDNRFVYEFEPVIESKPSNKKKVRKKEFKESTCVYCDYEIKTKEELLTHSSTHLSDGSYPCPNPHCVKKFKLWRGVLTHMKNQNCTNIKRFICHTCGKECNHKHSFIKHLRVHTNETPFACPHCPGRFTQRVSLNRHIKIHTGEKPVSCSICTKRFYTKKEVKRHQSVHTNDRTFECHICNLLFKTKAYLDVHITRMHLERKTYECDICGKTVFSKNNLIEHITRQHSVNSGHCKVCSKHVPNLEVHMWTHTGQKNFKCEACNGSFVSYRALSIHMSVMHKNANRYKCTFEKCDMYFMKPSLRQSHIAKVHKKAFTHSCDICSKGFYGLSNLASHLKHAHNKVMNNKK